MKCAALCYGEIPYVGREGGEFHTARKEIEMEILIGIGIVVTIFFMFASLLPVLERACDNTIKDQWFSGFEGNLKAKVKRDEEIYRSLTPEQQALYREWLDAKAYWAVCGTGRQGDFATQYETKPPRENKIGRVGELLDKYIYRPVPSGGLEIHEFGKGD